MEKDGASEFKGKSLDEIDLDMNENLLDNTEKSDESECDESHQEDKIMLITRFRQPLMLSQPD